MCVGVCVKEGIKRGIVSVNYVESVVWELGFKDSLCVSKECSSVCVSDKFAPV